MILRVCLGCRRPFTGRGPRCAPCKTLRQRTYDASRPPGTRAFYASSEWKRVSSQVLAGATACHWCGRTGVRLLADHVVPVRDNWEARLEGPVVPSCWACNTNRGRGRPPTRWQQETLDALGRRIAR